MITPFVSIIVPVFNGEQTLRDCLGAILRLEYPAERREILVVDNASRDRSPDIIKSFPVTYLRECRRSRARARNAAIRASRGEILAFTDADCIVTARWLSGLVRPFEDQTVGGVAGEIVAYPPQTAVERHAAKIRHLSPQKYLARPLLPFAVFANLAFRKSVFDRIGLLDENLLQGESTDFCTRFLRGTGLRLHFAPSALAFHRHRRTAGEWFWQQWGYGRGHALLYIKYRRDIPWGWRQSVLAYRDIARAAWALARALPHRASPAHRDQYEFCYFECLKKVAERLGFIRESLAQGYLYF